MPYTVYILQNRKGRYYIGSTNNIARRLSEHVRGQSKYCRENGPWRMVYDEEYSTELEARRREREIKNKKRKSYIYLLIETKQKQDSSPGPVV